MKDRRGNSLTVLESTVGQQRNALHGLLIGAKIGNLRRLEFA